MTTYFAQTLPGVEEIAWLEIRDKLSNARFGEYLFIKERNGIVVFESSSVPAETLKLRSAEDLFLMALNRPKLSRGYSDLRELPLWIGGDESLGQAIRSLTRFRKFSGVPTFRVYSRAYGKHEYRASEFDAVITQAFHERLDHWTPTASKPQVEIWANLLGSHLLIGLRLSRRTVEQAADDRGELPPSMAAALVLLTEPRDDDVFLDPMSRNGRILQERRLASPYGQLLGGDSDQQRVVAARQNVRRGGHGAASRIDIRQWDARQLPLEAASVDKIATVFAFGKQREAAPETVSYYEAAMGELSRVLRPGGRAVILTSQFEMLKGILRNYERLKTLTGYSVALRGIWGRIYLVEKGADS